MIPRGGTPEQAIARVESAATNIAAGASATVEQDAITTAAPELWTLDNPNLYTCLLYTSRLGPSSGVWIGRATT